MTIQAKLLCAVAVTGFAALAATAPAQALTTQECSAKYQAAKSAGTLNGQKWNDFRKAECGAAATAAPRSSRRLPRRRPRSQTRPGAEDRPPPRPRRCRWATPYSRPPSIRNIPRNSAGKGRMHTCVDQYNANKASNGNGGMKWIQKGGGYYSECNKRLKGAA